MNPIQTKTSTIQKWDAKPEEPTHEPMLVDALGACRLLGGICERTLHSMKQSGEIPHVRIGRRVLYPVAALQEWITEQTQGGAK